MARFALLRQEHGIAWRKRTWIEEILPAYGKPLTDPALARDLLAAAALDAGGIRADLVGIAEAHSRGAILVTGTVLLESLRNALAACEGSTHPLPPPSDPSSWPAATWVTATRRRLTTSETLRRGVHRQPVVVDACVCESRHGDDLDRGCHHNEFRYDLVDSFRVGGRRKNFFFFLKNFF